MKTTPSFPHRILLAATAVCAFCTGASAPSVAERPAYFVEWLGSIGVPVFPESVYGLAEIPHRVILSDIVWTVAIVYAFGWLASFIPALIASTKDPVKALET